MAAPCTILTDEANAANHDPNNNITQEIFPYPNPNVNSTMWKYFGFLKKNEGQLQKPTWI